MQKGIFAVADRPVRHREPVVIDAPAAERRNLHEDQAWEVIYSRAENAQEAQALIALFDDRPDLAKGHEALYTRAVMVLEADVRDAQRRNERNERMRHSLTAPMRAARAALAVTIEFFWPSQEPAQNRTALRRRAAQASIARDTAVAEVESTLPDPETVPAEAIDLEPSLPETIPGSKAAA